MEEAPSQGSSQAVSEKAASPGSRRVQGVRESGEALAAASHRPGSAWSLEDFRAQPTDLEGAVLGGRYRIVGFVGRGATADVYLAEDLEAGAFVVVKRLTETATCDPEISGCFLREATAAQSIQHPNVVRLLSVQRPPDDRPFLVIEALAGESLGDYLRRESSMPHDLALLLCRQMAAGLSAAHRSGVVHRDVKPDNLFLLGGPGRPDALKILDFGMAKVDSLGTGTTDLVMGTVHYMAPEQIVLDPVDGRTDIYALGVVMFRMFTGQLPFDTAPGTELLGHQLFSPAPPPSWLDEDLDSRVEAIMLRAMRKHPDNRYPNMDSLLGDLDAVLGSRSGQAAEVKVPPLEREPDVYVPRNAHGRKAAEVIARRFGSEIVSVGSAGSASAGSGLAGADSAGSDSAGSDSVDGAASVSSSAGSDPAPPAGE